MAEPDPSEQGTLVIAVMLLLALAFAGYWIATYARLQSPPWHLLPWFLLAQAVVGGLGLLASMRRGRGTP